MNQSCVLVHGHQEFPTPPEHTNLEFISRLSTRFSHIADIGFADHTSPTEYHISRACEIAIGAGAKYIEKHVCIERSETKIDYHSSLEASEFTKYLENISSAISVFLSNKETESRSINEYLQNMKKFPVPRSNIFEGQEIRKSEIVDLRVSSDLPCVAKIKGGEIAKSDLERFKGISFNQLKFGITAVVLCRSDSKRMENKALNAISGQIPIIHLLKRITHSKLVDNIVLATTNRTIDDKLCEVAETNNFQVYRGSELDVLQRMVEAASEFKSNHVVRITGDDICLSYDDLDDALVAHLSANAHYTNMLTIPSGTEAEIFDFEFLCDFNSSRDEQWDTEYLSNYVNVFDDVEIRRIGFTSKFDRNRDWRLTLDNHEDFSLLEEVFSRLIRIGKIDNYTLDDIVKIIEEEPKLLEKARNRNKRHHKKDSYGELFRWQLN
jgi:spore coat polysaccharide biosynthesis protein SpsF (cytidylyltransferase family)